MKNILTTANFKANKNYYKLSKANMSDTKNKTLHWRYALSNHELIFFWTFLSNEDSHGPSFILKNINFFPRW